MVARAELPFEHLAYGPVPTGAAAQGALPLVHQTIVTALDATASWTGH
jgi:hypothetical protein